jgi:hypothetical protein
MPERAAPSFVLALALTLSGCAGLIGGKEPVSVGASSRPLPPAPLPSPSLPSPSPLPPGQSVVSVQKGRPGYIIGAPHGTTDIATDLIGLELARRTGFGAVVVTGEGSLDVKGRRYNVSRPTEGVPGDPPRSEVETDAARRVYEGYARSVGEAAQGPLRFYVEVHGNAHQDTAGRVEIATVGLTKEEAWRLKTLLELVRDAHLGGQPDVAKLDIFVEPVDTLRYTASASKSGGLLGRSDKSLHIELPKAARTTYREVYTAVLADFLSQWIDLLATMRAR